MPDRRRAVRAGDLTPANTDRRSLRRNIILVNAFEFCLGVAAFITGLTFILDPATLVTSAVGEAAGGLRVLWGALYLLGGLLICCGMLMPRIEVEMAGLMIFAPAVLTDSVALFLTRGPAAARIILVSLSFALAASLRVYLLYRTHFQKVPA